MRPYTTKQYDTNYNGFYWYLVLRPYYLFIFIFLFVYFQVDEMPEEHNPGQELTHEVSLKVMHTNILVSALKSLHII